MTIDLHIVGPGLDVSRRLAPGEPALILGRDADCTVCLPDPLRSVSRRHLSVWNDGNLLHFHVLSVVNGVVTEQGDLPPGARGALLPGQWLVLSEYRLSVVADSEPADVDSDPWAEFERQTAQLTVPTPVLEEDPFGDSGFHDTFGAASPDEALDADGLAPATDLTPFLKGLGMSGGGAPTAFTRGELETIGRFTRAALEGLLQALQAAGGSRQAVRSEDRTMLDPFEVNPLRMDSSLETRLWYLFGGQAAARGSITPDRAVRELVADLLAHQHAMAEAARQAIEGTVHEFDPEALKARLLPGGPKLFESARAWDAFVRDYAERKQDLPGWVRRLMDRYFAEAYAQALLRIKHHKAPPTWG